MSYGSIEASVESGQPVYLYEFTSGSDVYRLHNSEGEITALSQTWLPESIAHSEPTLGPADRMRPIQIVMTANHALVSPSVTSTRPDVTLVTIRRVHRQLLADPYIVFTGVVRNVNWRRRTAEAMLTVLPFEGRFSKRVPRIPFSGQCPLMLFGQNCKVVRASFLYSGTASSVLNDTLVVAGLDAATTGSGWATSGEVVVLSTGERRLVRVHGPTLDTVSLLYPFDMNPSGETVEVAAGCDRLVATCNSKFSNVANFGGFPNVPGRNPFTVGRI